MKKIKQWLKSKTIDFGLLLQIAGVVQLYADSLGNGMATMAIGIIVIILRAKTHESLADK